MKKIINFIMIVSILTSNSSHAYDDNLGTLTFTTATCIVAIVSFIYKFKKPYKFSLGSLCIIQFLIHSAVAIAEEKTFEQRKRKKQQLLYENAVFSFLNDSVQELFVATVDNIVDEIDRTGKIPTHTEAEQILIKTNLELSRISG